MIPKHIIEKAVNAAGENWVLALDWEHDKLYAQVHAALEAVAADIWEQGYATRASAWMFSDRYPFPDEDEAKEIEYARRYGQDAAARSRNNPYRIEHT